MARNGYKKLSSTTGTLTSPKTMRGVLEKWKISGDLKQKSKNLFDPSLWATSITTNGITVQYLVNEDCFVLNGTATNSSPIYTRYINLPIIKGSYFSASTRYVSGIVDRTNGVGAKRAVAYFGAANSINTFVNWTAPLLNNSDYIIENRVCNYDYITSFWFYILEGITFTNYKVKIQLEEGSTATDYVSFLPSPESPIYPALLGTPSVNGFDLANLEQGNISDITGLNSVGTTRVRNTDYITLSPGNYYVKLNNAGSMIIRGMYKYNLSNVFISFTVIAQTFNSFTLTEATKVRFTIRNADNVSDVSVAEVQAALPQLQLGSSATAYEPFGKYKVPVDVNGTITNIWTSQPLGRIGDAVDSVSSDGVERFELKTLNVTSGTGWSYFSYSDTLATVYANDTTNGWGSTLYSSPNVRCSISQIGTTVNKFSINRRVNDTQLIFMLSKTDLISQDNAGAVAWINAHVPFQIYYPLATPTETTIEVPRIEAKEGTMNVGVQTTEDYFLQDETRAALQDENNEPLMERLSVTVQASTINAELWNSNY